MNQSINKSCNRSRVLIKNLSPSPFQIFHGCFHRHKPNNQSKNKSITQPNLLSLFPDSALVHSPLQTPAWVSSLKPVRSISRLPSSSKIRPRCHRRFRHPKTTTTTTVDPASLPADCRHRRQRRRRNKSLVRKADTDPDVNPYVIAP